MANKRQRQFVYDWLKALRSKEFQQTQGSLRSIRAPDGSYSYCCLGVACTLRRGVWFHADDYSFDYRFSSGYLAAGGDLGKKFHELTGLEHPEHPKWASSSGEGSFQATLIELNDNGKDFREIANVISKRATEVFGRGWMKEFR